MRLAWQPIFEREWEQNSERFQIGKSLHLKEKRHFCKQALDNPSHGRGIAGMRNPEASSSRRFSVRIRQRNVI